MRIQKGRVAIRGAGRRGAILPLGSVVAGALRLLAVPPDDLSHVPSTTLVQTTELSR